MLNEVYLKFLNKVNKLFGFLNIIEALSKRDDLEIKILIIDFQIVK
ncbi:MAG: hypothetical protein ACJAWV_001720 [Flammeovirgaceae bacterium]|jgi:hypothetical protein